MDNKFYNEQKDKYAKGKTNNTNQPNTSASDENLAQELDPLIVFNALKFF